MIGLVTFFGYVLLKNLAEDLKSRGLRYVAEIYVILGILVFAGLFLWADGFSIFD